MNKTFLKMIIGPLWKWGVSMPFEIIGIISAFNPDEIGSFWSVEWYWWIIFGLLIWGLVTAYDAARIVGELEKEIVEIEMSGTVDTGAYLGNDTVYLLISNHEDFDLRDCYANLFKLEHKVIHNEQELLQNMLVLINPNRNKLHWPAYGFGVEKVVPPGKPERIDIARIENDKLTFLFENENSNLELQGNYYLEVEIGGYINNKPFKRKKLCGRLSFNYDYGKYRITLLKKDCENGRSKRQEKEEQRH